MAGVRRCAWCGKRLGRAPDLPDGEVTHGICPRCLRKLYAEEGTIQQPLGSGDHPEVIIAYGAVAIVGGGLGWLLAPVLGTLGCQVAPWASGLVGLFVAPIALSVWLYIR